MSGHTTRVVHVNDNVPDAVYIGRRMSRQGLKGSPWANHYKIGEYGRTRVDVIRLYREGLVSNLMNPATAPGVLKSLSQLIDKPLACWCRHDGEELTQNNACHGDVLIEVFDRYDADFLRDLAKRGDE